MVPARLVLFIPLLILGFLLAVFNWRLPGSPAGEIPAIPQVQAETDLLPQVQDEYEIFWSNPRYETDLNLQPNMFKVEVEVVNISFPGKLQMVVNCDLTDAVGVGVSFDHNTVMVPLQAGQRVSACRYTPTGAYDPNLAVEARF